ncbi:MAG: SMP-30/gluconolactonase/LRE family protein [Syntrophales bacterium]|nr:SMP-30/gluconolactonase/LRE family protein [Syntrophales bacterium]
MEIPLNEVKTIGSGLVRPEGVMVTDDGFVWAADGRGGLAKISPDNQTEIVGGLGGIPNGICFDQKGNCIIANIGSGEVQKINPYRKESHTVLFREVEGKKTPAPNFPYVDTKGRLWVSNSTYRSDVQDALQHPAPDGCIILYTEEKVKIVAEGIYFANGLALDKEEKYLFVAETMKRRVIRFPILPDSTLGPPEVYGPPFLGRLGFPDGIAFDEADNLWVTLPMENAIGIITLGGEFHKVLEDKEGKVIRQPSNICFGGPDRKTAFIGSLGGTNIPYFRVPHPGLRLIHQSV